MEMWKSEVMCRSFDGNEDARTEDTWRRCLDPLRLLMTTKVTATWNFDRLIYNRSIIMLLYIMPVSAFLLIVKPPTHIQGAA